MADTEKQEKFSLEMETNPPDLAAGLNRIKNKSQFGTRTQDVTLVNHAGANTSIRLGKNQINEASSQNVSNKLNAKQAIQTSFEEKHVTNRLKLDTYEMVVNGHKLNPNLWEYSDFKKYTDMYNEIHAVGFFCTEGTILTPSWDAQLHRYVLIRRRCRMPLFSPKNNVPDILKTLNIEDPTKVVYKYGVKQSTMTAEEYYNQVGKQYDKKKYASESASSVSSSSAAGGGAGTATNEIVEKGIQWALQIAADDTHGYSQANRTGPDYDCTSFISTGLIQGGLDIEVLGGSGFDSTLVEKGFREIPFGEVGESGLKRGDILSNPSHVEWYIGGGQVVGAHS